MSMLTNPGMFDPNLIGVHTYHNGMLYTFIFLVVTELHGMIGLYRLAVKWDIFAKNPETGIIDQRQGDRAGLRKGMLIVAVLMIEDRPAFDQDTEKPDLTTTTAVRLLLDQAADVEGALELLEQYDLHASAGMMVHFALSDASGRSVVVEYVNNEMMVTETPVVTNFYLAPGEKYGIGSQESHTRYEILSGLLAEQGPWSMDGVRDALNAVSKHNFDSAFASTEWSIVYDQSEGVARYYHRENYDTFYDFTIR